MNYVVNTTTELLYSPLYNLSKIELEVLRIYLDNALRKGWIRYLLNPAKVPIIFILKRDGGLRLYVDYRALNKITVENRHLLLLISETLDRLYKVKVFSELDLKDTCYRIRIKKGHKRSRTGSTPRGLVKSRI